MSDIDYYNTNITYVPLYVYLILAFMIILFNLTYTGTIKKIPIEHISIDVCLYILCSIFIAIICALSYNVDAWICAIILILCTLISAGFNISSLIYHPNN
jgi:hypothetical protein